MNPGVWASASLIAGGLGVILGGGWSAVRARQQIGSCEWLILDRKRELAVTLNAGCWGMLDMDLVLGAAVALNLGVAIAGMLWSPSHHRALASMLGVTWLGRAPLFRGEGKLRRGFRARAGVGLFALREIVLTVGAILVGTGLALVVSAGALLMAQDAAAGSVLLSGRAVTNVTEMLVAMGVHFVAARAPDAAVLVAAPTSVFPGGLWVTALLLSVGLVVTAAGLRAVAELCRVFWFTVVCLALPTEAAVALEERRGLVRWVLAVPRAS